MSGRIKLTPQELRTSAAKYTKGSTEVRQILSMLDKEQATIRTNWEGSAFRKFDEQYNSLTPKIRDFAELLDQINKQLVSVANIIEETDQKIASQINAL
jgi:WXG100 family type VII secretion target